MDSLRTLKAVTYKTNGDLPWRAEIWLDDMPQNEWYTDCADGETAIDAARTLHDDIICGWDKNDNAILNNGEVVFDCGVIVNATR